MTEERLKIIRAITDLANPTVKRDVNIDEVAWLKQMLTKDLYSDSDIIEALHNVELQEANALPEEYRNVNIFSYLKVPDTQSVVKNFICFEVNDMEQPYNATSFIERNIVFRCISHEDDVRTEYGIDRQDLIAMLVKDRMSWTNFMGMRISKEYDVGKIAENGYYYREIRFFVLSPNAMVQKGNYIQSLDKDRKRYSGQ